MQLFLSDGTRIENPFQLINDYYEVDAHELYDKLHVPQDNELDLVALSSLAFFEVYNPRLEHWRKLWDLRNEVELILKEIPSNLVPTCIIDYTYF